MSHSVLFSLNFCDYNDKNVKFPIDSFVFSVNIINILLLVSLVMKQSHFNVILMPLYELNKNIIIK